MKPLSLRLKGFRGIRDGLARDEIALDLERITAGAQLIALAGSNGRGKTTLMENLTPYPVMPSRAGADGLGSFSFYDHLCLPENEKELIYAINSLTTCPCTSVRRKSRPALRKVSFS